VIFTVLVCVVTGTTRPVAVETSVGTDAVSPTILVLRYATVGMSRVVVPETVATVCVPEVTVA